MNNSERKGHTRIQWAIASIANLLLVTYGLQSTWVSPMAKVLQSEASPIGRPMTDSEISWLASCPSLGAMVAVLVMLYIVDIFGRKYTIMSMTILQALSWIIKILPCTATTLIISRCLCGLAAGGCFHVVPMYIKEIAQDNIRGALGSMFILSQCAGVFFIYLLGGYLDYYVVLWIVVGLPIVTFLAFFKAPESPAFLIKKGKKEEAAKTIAFLRGLSPEDKEVQQEVNTLIAEHEYFVSLPKMTLVSILKVKQYRLAFIIMVLVMFAHATNGAFVVVNYAATIMAQSGVVVSPELQTLSIPLFMIVAAVLVMCFVDNAGRKPILIGAFVLSAIAFTYLASALMLTEWGWNVPGYLNVVPIVVTVFCYGGGVSPVPYIVMTEIFNFQIRAILMGYIVIFAWSMSFAQLFLFGYVSNSVGPYAAFYCFGCMNTLGALITLFLLPETKNKTTDEIERILTGESRKN